MAISLGAANDVLAEIWPKDQCAVLYELARQCPGQDVELTFGNSSLIILQSAGSFAHILRDRPEIYNKSLGKFVKLIGESRLSTDGDLWQYLRGLSNTDITRVDPTSIINAVQSPFEAARDRLVETSSKGDPIDIDPIIEQAAAKSVCDGLLGFPSEIYSAETLADIVVLARLARVLNYGGFGFEQEELERLVADGDAANERLTARLDDMWDARVESSPQVNDLLARIFSDSTGKVDPKGEILTLFAAGFETTASSIGWGLFLLANNPDLQNELREECLTHLGRKGVSLEGLEACHRLQSFTRESLRIFPTLPMIGRMATEHDRIGDTLVRPGQIVLGSIIGLHMNENVFPDPSTVDPGRFQNGVIPRELQGNYMPFSDGRRVCPGVRFAGYEIAAALSILLRALRVGSGPKVPLRFDWVFTLRRFGGQKLVFESLP